MDSSTPQPAQRYAPPTAEVADISASGTTLAGRGLRLGGVIIDSLLLVFLLWLVGLVTPWKLYSPAIANAGMVALLGYQLLSFVIFMLVNGTLLVTRGQTVGKMLLGMRIVCSDGSQPTAARLIGMRYGIWWLIASVPFVGGIFSLIDALVVFRESRQCLHDNIAGTIVIKT